MDAHATEKVFCVFSETSPIDARPTPLIPYKSLLTILILAVLCGDDGWAAVESWGLMNRDWLETFLDLPHAK